MPQYRKYSHVQMEIGHDETTDKEKHQSRSFRNDRIGHFLDRRIVTEESNQINSYTMNTMVNRATKKN